MILDYHQSTKAFTLRVSRKEADVQALMKEHGLDFSTSASTQWEAVLFTREPYAAVSFFEYATIDARAELENLQALISASAKMSSNIHVKCPADKELWPYQKADVEYILQRHDGNGFHVLDADQPGLGKTPVAICVANEIDAQNVLVICPANIRLQWLRRIWEWTTLRWPVTIEAIVNSRRGVNPDAHWTVVSYELARSEAIGKALAERRYDLLILDEAHYLKTTDSRRTRSIFGGGERRLFEPLAERSRSVLALTGTPLPNRPREAYTLARALCWDSIDWASEDAFRERFNPSRRVEVVSATGEKKFFIDERSGRHFELQNRLRANFMTRHLKREVLPQLKMPAYDLVYVEDSGPVKQALAAESLLDIDPDDLEGQDMEVLGHVAVVRRLMGIAMAPQVADYIDMLIEGGEEKLVLFAWHIEVLNMLQARLQKHGLVRIDATVSQKRKEILINDFIQNPRTQIILGNTLTLGTGTDGLQEVSCHALIAEADWTPGNNIQCFDRLDRAGQQRAVQGDIFVAKNSFSERVLASALRKLSVTDRALDRKVA